MKKKKINIKPKIKLILGISISVIFIIILLFICFNKVNVGKIKKGKAVYTKEVANVTKYKDKILVEFNNNYELIDNCIISTELYNDFKKGNVDIYNLTLKDYDKLSTLSAKESYNIHKAIDLKLVTEDTKYTDYFAVTCGFKNKKELLKYTKAVFDLANKEKDNK